MINMKIEFSDIFQKIDNLKNNTIKKIKNSFLYKCKPICALKNILKIFYGFIKKHKYICAPIIMLFLISIGITYIFGMEFSKLPVSQVPTVIVNHDTSHTAQNLVDMISQNEVFNVIKYSEDNEDIKEALDKGQAATGILIPENFSEDILNGKSAKIMTFYDGTMTSTSSVSKGKIAEVLNTIKSGYLMGIAEGKFGLNPQMAKSVIAPMGYSYRLMGNPTNNMAIFMVQGLILTVIEVGVAVVGASISENKSYIKLILKGIIIAILGTICAFICSAILVKQFGIPYRGTISGGIVLALFCNIGTAFFGVFLNISQKGDKHKAISSCSIVALTLLLSGYTYPVIAMPEIFSKIKDYLPNTHFLMPIRDIALLGYGINDVLDHIIWLVKFSLIMIALVSLIYVTSHKKIKKNVEKIPSEVIA